MPKALGFTTDQWVKERLGGYVRLAVSERREVVAELAAEGLSQRQIAAVVGVSTGTVNRDLGVPNGTCQAEKATEYNDQQIDDVPNGTDSICLNADAR